MPAPRTERIPTPDRQADLFDLIGSTLAGKYRLERLLGVGGMGGVFAAAPLAGGPAVAVKVLSVADPSAHERIAKRFAREARAVSALRCPNIVTILDAGTDGPRTWLAMELLEGEDLGQHIHDGALSVADTAHVARQVLVALAAAHAAGIVHRDLKPDNVFVAPRADDPLFCKLLDFGMSKLLPTENQTLAIALTKKGMAVGTPIYMAPEQARAVADVDGRVDLWSLGAIMFECLTGRPPFLAASQEQVLIAICTVDAPDVRALRPDVPSPFAKLIKRALARDRAERFQSAAEMQAALADVTGRPAPAATASLSGSTVAIAPITLPPDASGGYAPSPALVSELVSEAPRPRSLWRFVVVGVCALIAGVGVAAYVLTMTR